MDPFDNPTVKLNSSKLAIGNSNFTPGQLLAGRYKVLRVLGRGGMGVVLEVENVLIRKQFALKLLDLQEDSSAALPRFQREAKLLSGLVHPNIVRALDFGLLDEAVPYVLMELMTGVTLTQRLRQSGPMSEKEVVEKFVPILEGLQYAHQNGVVHRDIKPGNIMLTDSGTGVQTPKILDFGIAASTESASEALTRTGEIIGTPLYMSPEQVSGGSIKASSDIYSLGCVMFEALTGAPPFNGRTALETMMLHKSESPPTLKSASLGNVFSERMERTILKMLAKESEDRFQTCVQVIAALTGADTAREVIRKPEEQTVQGLTIERMLGVGAFLLLVVSIVGFAAWFHFGDVGKTSKESEDSNAAHKEVTSINSSPLTSTQIEVPVDPLAERQNEEDLSSKEYMKRSGGIRHFDLSDEKVPIGEFDWVDPHGVPQQGGFTKTDTIKIFSVPDECKLWFKPSPQVMRKQYFLEKFNAANLNGIRFSFEHTKRMIPPVAMSSCIRGMAHIPALYIDRTDLPDQVVDNLNSLWALRWFSMQTIKGGDLSDEQAKRFAQSLNLNQLQVLNLILERSVAHKHFLNALVKDLPRKQPHLLALGLARCKLDEEDFKNIGKLKDLKFLNIIDTLDPSRCTTERAMDLLKSCHNLETIVMGGEQLHEEAAKTVIGMKSMRHMDFRNFETLRPTVKAILARGGVSVSATDDVSFGFQPWREKPKY